MSASNAKDVQIDIEYCGKCGYHNKFHELSAAVLKENPDVKVNGHVGRRGSFEVQVNGTLVHSKLSTLAFPDFDDVTKIAKNASDGKEIKAVECKQQPITDCVLS